MSKIFDTQQRIATLLTADAKPNGWVGTWAPVFGDPNPAKRIPVIMRREGNIVQKVQEYSGRPGIYAVVLLPKATKVDERGPVILLTLTFGISIKEVPTVNQQANVGTGKPAELAVERAIKLLHWQPNDLTVGSKLSDENRFQIEKNAVQLLRPTPGDVPLSYAVYVGIQIRL